MLRTSACAALAAALLSALPQPAASAPAASASVQPFGPAAEAKALDRIAALIESKYVYKDKAAAIAAEVRGLKSDRELARARDRGMWSAILTRRLKAHDIHFDVSWSPPDAGHPVLTAAVQPDLAAMDRSMAAANYGFREVQRLPGNIGYIRMSFFAPFDRTLTGDKTPGARQAGEAALRLVGNTDAVIFDLRQNGGGSPDMIDLLLSGFFGDKPVLLNRLYRREGDKTVDFSTLADYRGPRRPTVPIYVLTSGRTASAAEEFAYDLQSQKRGVIVGETSAGGANPGATFDAGDGFRVFVSTGAAVNPITHTNWERVGVKPDVAVDAADALDRAHALALAEVLKRNASTAPTEARWALERLNAEHAGVHLSPEEAAAYVGAYGEQRVAFENGELVHRHDRFPPQRMIPLGGDAFALDGSPGLRLTFERGADRRAAVLVVTDADGDTSSFARSQTAAAR
jgi:hypothetical protein